MYHHTPFLRLARLFPRLDPPSQSVIPTPEGEVDEDPKFRDRVPILIVPEVEVDGPSFFMEETVVVKHTRTVDYVS
jgi:hypothetical protein